MSFPDSLVVLAPGRQATRRRRLRSLRGHHNDRTPDTHGGGASAHRTWGIRCTKTATSG